MLICRRRMNQLCAGVLITCILCVVSMLFLSPNSRTGSARHLFKRSRIVVVDRAINHSKPFIDFIGTVPPVLDESGYFIGKVYINADWAQAGSVVEARMKDDSFKSVKGVGIKAAWQSTLPKSADVLIDILDSKISQIPQMVELIKEVAPVDDVDLAHDFLQLHRALKPVPKKNNPVHVLIVTNRRSGSSFLGQIFNQNPNIFFNFEPLKLLEKKPDIYANQSVFLNLLLSCKFKKMPFLMDFYNKERLHRSRSLALSSPPLCTLNVAVNSTNVRQCDKLHPTFSASVCARYSHTAAKLIRLYNISSLEKLVTQEELNLKIIHLVRDPRGILSSRSVAENKTLNIDKSLDGEARYLCRRIKSNLRLVSSSPPWLEDRYKLVRYEDIAYDPEKWVNEVYKYTGLGSVPSEVLSWIRTNTKSQQSTDTYSTSRNSKETAEAWRKHISLPVVKRIDEVCKDVLSFLKYKSVENVDQLRNMEESLVKPLSP